MSTAMVTLMRGNSAALALRPQKNGFCRPPPCLPASSPQPGDRAGADILKVLKRCVSSGDLRVLRLSSDSCGSGEGASMLTSVFTFVKCVPKQHGRELFHFPSVTPIPRELAGRHMQVSCPVLRSDSRPSSRDEGFLPGLGLSALLALPWGGVASGRSFSLSGGCLL